MWVRAISSHRKGAGETNLGGAAAEEAADTVSAQRFSKAMEGAIVPVLRVCACVCACDWEGGGTGGGYACV
jgi:hypothetical protein